MFIIEVLLLWAYDKNGADQNHMKPKNNKGVIDMPRGDGTGPMGMGPMTGRRAGFCAGAVAPGAMNAPGMFGGFGCRRGGAGMMRGAGFQARNQFAAQQGVQANAMVGSEREILTRQVDFLEKQLQQVKQRLESVSDSVE